MIRKIAQYRVKPDKVGEVRTALGAFLAAVAREEPDTIYEVYQGQDGVSFIHWMTFADEHAEAKYQSAEYTHTFVNTLLPFCDGLPEAANLRLMGSAQDS